MVRPGWTRRAILRMGCAGLAFPAFARADEALDLGWQDLLPEHQPRIPNSLQGVLPHDETAMSAAQPVSTGVRTDWNGKRVRLPGFILPLEFDRARVSTFILVPFVGACVHVPPPPANQLVLVSTRTPYDSDGLYEAVSVTGTITTTAISTHLADIGYALTAEQVAPYA